MQSPLTAEKGENEMAIYLGTIALEKNRWEKDQTATIDVPAYIERAVKDGFDGVELWGPHYLLADEKEKKRIEKTGHVEIFNTYARFDEGITEELRVTAEAINKLNPKAIKFNFENKEKRDLQVATIKEFSGMLNPEIRLLCECHLFTLMDNHQIAADIFNDLGERFGAMVHTRTGALSEAEDFEDLKCRFETYGKHICHLHASNYNGKEFIHIYDGDVVKKHIDYILSQGFNGNCTIEFTVGEEAEEMYQNALKDLAWLNQKGLR